jgi:hypothetical protein
VGGSNPRRGAQQREWAPQPREWEQGEGTIWDGQQQQERQRQQRRPLPPPDVILLTQREIQALLPIGATGEQYAYFWGGVETAVQRFGISVLGFVATVNLTALIAVPTATFFLWAPVALAARRNSAARRGRNVGLWRAVVMSVATQETGPGRFFGSQEQRRAGAAAGGSGGGGGGGGWMLLLLVGDASGARVELRVPLLRQHAEIREGDAVEMVVGSDKSYFAEFEAVREAYFPASGAWVGEYPFLDRRAMPAISGRIARDAEERDVWARPGGNRVDTGGVRGPPS